jgi:hypothetical protein
MRHRRKRGKQDGQHGDPEVQRLTFEVLEHSAIIAECKEALVIENEKSYHLDRSF